MSSFSQHSLSFNGKTENKMGNPDMPMCQCSTHNLLSLDYCNALLPGSPQALLHTIQRVINRSAHLICKARKSAHIILLLYDLHWIPISSRSQYKIGVICSLSLFSLSRGCSDLPCLLGWAGGHCGDILSMCYWVCDLELSFSLCNAFFFVNSSSLS